MKLPQRAAASKAKSALQALPWLNRFLCACRPQRVEQISAALHSMSRSALKEYERLSPTWGWVTTSGARAHSCCTTLRPPSKAPSPPSSCEGKQLPRVGRIDEQTCVCFGYNGVGIAMATLLGRYAGSLMAGESLQLNLLDASRQKPVPFHSLRTPGVRMVAGWYQMLDALGR